MPTLILKPGREKALLRRHPWVFSGAVAKVKGNPASGDTVAIADHRGQFLAWASYSPQSRIRARVWSWREGEVIGPDFFHRRVGAALARRASWLGADTDAYRLVFAEADGLPGVIADRYGETVVVQFLSAGAEVWREAITDALQEATGAARVYERSDAEVRRLEGLPPRVGVLRGDEPPDLIRIAENGRAFWVDVRRGHKTGFYLDQRGNRAWVGAHAAGRRVLNAFAYTGGFAVYALAGGASEVVSVDTSAEALALARENIALNGLPAGRAAFLQEDVFHLLRKLHSTGEKFDMVILDPPKFAPTAAQVPRAARGYKDINRLAFHLLPPGGLLVTFSCSGGLDAALFQKIVADAAVDAGVEARIVARLTQGVDHPVALNYPESAYLKGLVVVVG